jgi:hypothetical protein
MIPQDGVLTVTQNDLNLFGDLFGDEAVIGRSIVVGKYLTIINLGLI